MRRSQFPAWLLVLLLLLTLGGLRAPLLVEGGVGPSSGWLELHVIDVGQGDAAVVRTPGGPVLVIDAGRTGDEVVDYLLQLGVTEIEAILPSHAHLDHYGGLRQVVDALPVREVWQTGQRGTPTWDRFQAKLAALGIFDWTLQDGQSWTTGGVTVEVFNPPDPPHTRDAEYDNSHVVRLSYGAFSVLFTGDLHERGELALLARRPLPPSTVLKVSEHGGGTGTTQSFLDTVRPQVAVISAGRNNRYGHPTARVLTNLDAAGAQVLRTDHSGTLVLRSDGTSVQGWATSDLTTPLVALTLADGPGVVPPPPLSPTPVLRYDPQGEDRDCTDFAHWPEAQAFYEATGGPDRDPHRLDPDRDGIACESLPGAPRR